MAPTTRQATKTKVGEEVLHLVVPYIHNVDDRSSVSLVSRNFYEVEGITRKHLTVHVHYYPNLTCLSKRFPFIESLTLKGPPPDSSQTHYDPDIRITPWIEQLALEFRCSKEICIHRLVVHDEDLETFARIRGKDLRSLKITKCKGFSTYGLMQVSKYSFKSTVLERFHFTNTYISEKDVTLLAKNYCNSLISLKIEECYLSKLGDAFRYAFRLEHFGGYSCDDKSELIRKLKLVFACLDEDQQCLLFMRCTNVGLISLAKGCTNLESLDLILGNISNEALECVGTHLKNLDDFHMHLVKDDGTTGKSNAGLVTLSEGCLLLASFVFNLPSLRYVWGYSSDFTALALTRLEFRLTHI
nr:hypothetical protein [Tanacetum cinerariifolium]